LNEYTRLLLQDAGVPTLRQVQKLSLARERSQLPDLPSATVSLNISVLPPTSIVLNVA